MQPAVSGVNVDAGPLALRDLQIDFGESGSYPEGGQAPLRVWIDNRGTEPVVLEAVTSSAAEAVTLVVVEEETPTADGDSTTPETGETATSDDEESPDAATATPDSDATESPAGEDAEGVAELVGEREFAIEIAPSSHVRLAPGHGSFLLLEGLREEVSMASPAEVTFVFSNGEKVSVDVPVGVPEEAPSRSYFGDPHDEPAE